MSAASRVSVNGGPFIRPDGILLAPDPPQFLSGNLEAPPVVGSTGALYLTDNDDWTILGAPSITTPGTLLTTCNGWTSNAGTAKMLVSRNATTDVFKTGNVPQLDCNQTPAHLYCVEP